MKRAPISDEARLVLRVLEARELEKGRPLTREQRKQLRDEAAWALEYDVRAMCERGRFVPAPAPTRDDVAAAVEHTRRARQSPAAIPVEAEESPRTAALDELLRELGS